MSIIENTSKIKDLFFMRPSHQKPDKKRLREFSNMATRLYSQGKLSEDEFNDIIKTLMSIEISDAFIEKINPKG